ncbi:hypothetical protein OG559_12965 [Micromonospora sp. NBC_01405]|uniref:hypothetical protein n=1 Tax=Micromonospora sp. NBC_01405 TaxID=2903589 RepID=UPI00324F46EC
MPVIEIEMPRPSVRVYAARMPSPEVLEKSSPTPVMPPAAVIVVRLLVTVNSGRLPAWVLLRFSWSSSAFASPENFATWICALTPPVLNEAVAEPRRAAPCWPRPGSRHRVAIRPVARP